MVKFDKILGKLREEDSGAGSTDWGNIGGTLSDQTDLQTALETKVDKNTAIIGATKTKITYDAKGLVTAGADATTADIVDSTDKRYVTDAQLTVIDNTSGTNTGDQIVPDNEAGAPNNFLTAYNSSTGAWTKARPTWADIEKTTSSIGDITTKTHSLLSSLTADDHTQYALLAGRSGGQTIIGGTATTDTLKLQGTTADGTLTSPAVQAIVGNNGATTAITVLNNANVGIGTTAPTVSLDVVGMANFDFIRYKKNVWTSMSNAPNTFLTGASLVYDGSDSIFAVRAGGGTAFWRYSISSNSWTVMSTLPATTHSGSSFASTGGDHIYLIRGSSTTFWRYSISGGSWTNMASLAASTGAGADLIHTGGDYLYALRGNATATFYRYSISGNSWTTIANAPGNIGTGGSLTYTGGDYIYAVAGGSTNNFYRYSISTNTWTSLSTTPDTIGAGSRSVYSGGDNLYVTRGDNTDNFYRYSIAENSWVELSTLPASVTTGGGLVKGDGDYIYLINGTTSNFRRYTIGTDSPVSRIARAGLFLNDNVALGRDIAFAGATTRFINPNTSSSQLILSSPRVAIVANNVLGGLDFVSNDTDITDPGATTARIQAIATATHTNSVRDTALIFSTTTGTSFLEKMRITADGNVGIGLTSPTARLHSIQASTTGAIPTLRLEQSDVSQAFIRFDSTIAANNTNPLSTLGIGSYAGKLRINVNGTNYWIPYYNT